MTGIVSQFLANERRAKKRVRIARPPVAIPPDSVERDYRAYLMGIVEEANKLVDDVLIPLIPSLVRQVGGRTDAMHEDVRDVEARLKTATGTITARLKTARLRGLEAAVERYKAATSRHVLRQLRRQIRRMISIDAMPPVGTAERASMDAFLTQNVKLIQSLTGDYVSQVEDLVRRGVQAGTRASVIEREVKERWPVTQSRAALIARDQVNKLNGALTRVRQQALGIEKYIWRTSRDERVRNTHIVKEGKIYSWDSPPADTGHPGQDYQCRCTAEPYLEGEKPPAEDRKAVIRKVLRQRDETREAIKGKPGERLIPKRRPKGY